MVIQHNLASMFTQRELKTITGQKSKSTEKLSSGYRINRSADDAAGLAISEKMRWQIRGLDKASKNIQDGISYVQTGEGALNEVHDMLQRIRELAVQASNDTNTPSDRASINHEVNEIKKEMTRVFNDTEFNTKKIFRVPYIPDIEGEPTDYSLFNIGSGYEQGGVLINNKRYTWGELGTPETAVDSDWETEFKDGEEIIHLLMKKGDSLPNVRRVYQMSADSNGIFVNGVRAAEWGSTIHQNGNKYDFTYRGMNISFNANDEDTLDDIIAGINGDDITKVTWDVIPKGISDVQSAVNSGSDSMTFQVTESNKNVISDWTYQIRADQDGVQLYQKTGNDGLSHTKTKWEDFSNTRSGEESWPISDWGVEDEGLNPVTLDNAAVYRYNDAASAGYYTNNMSFTFAFPLDETGKEQTIKGLTQDLYGYNVSAPIMSVSCTSGAEVTGSNFTFEFQRDKLKRNFSTNAPMAVEIQRTKNIDGTVKDYEYRKELSEAYAHKLTNVETKTETEYGNNPVSICLYDPDGNLVESYSSVAEIHQKSMDLGSESCLLIWEHIFHNSIIDCELLAGSNFVADSTEQTVNTSEDEFVLNNGIAKDDTEHISSESSSSKANVLANCKWILPNGQMYTQGTKFQGTDGYYLQVFFDATEKKTVTKDSSYETAGNNLKNYVKTDGDQYQVVNTNDYYVKDSAEGNPLDTDGNGYREVGNGDAGKQRYIEIGSKWTEAKTYQLCHYDYSVDNISSEEIFNGNSGLFIDTNGNGSSTIVIHDKDGRAHQYNTDMNDTVKRISMSDGNNSYLALKYTNGSENRTNTVNITPDGAASRSFVKSSHSGGISTKNGALIHVNPPEKILHIQAGAKAYQSIDIKYPGLNNTIIGISGADVSTYPKAQATIEMADFSINFVSNVRGRFGALHNRMEHAYNIDQNTSENTQAAESRVRDTDMAKEIVQFSKSNIIAQAAQSMLTQANQQPQGILSLVL